jgi:hypothetical protein
MTAPTAVKRDPEGFAIAAARSERTEAAPNGEAASS